MRDEEFGREIYRQRMGGILLIGGIGALPIGLILTFSPFADPAVRTWIGPGFAIGGAVLLISGISRRRRVIVAYENGIVDSDIRLAFEDVEEFTANVMLNSIEGIRAGTDYQFTIKGKAATGPATLRFSSGNLRHDTSRVDELIDRVSQSVAARMIHSLEQGESVPWGKRVRLSMDGISMDSERAISFSDFTQHQLRDGELIISTTAGRRIRMSSSERNFYPGYALVRRLIDG